MDGSQDGGDRATNVHAQGTFIALELRLFLGRAVSLRTTRTRRQISGGRDAGELEFWKSEILGATAAFQFSRIPDSQRRCPAGAAAREWSRQPLRGRLQWPNHSAAGIDPETPSSSGREASMLPDQGHVGLRLRAMFASRFGSPRWTSSRHSAVHA